MSRWKSIETAPKDGRRVILFARGQYGIRDTYWAISSWLDKDRLGALTTESIWVDWPYKIRPTHWQNLPVPPEE